MDKEIATVKTSDLPVTVLKGLYSKINVQFDREMMRKESSQELVFQHKDYRASFIKNKGFILWWDFVEFVFVEYLLVKESCRDQGIGSRLLEEVKRKRKLIILEAEEKEEIKRFYTRNGFCVNDIEYKPIQINEMPVTGLILMSYDHKLSIQEYDCFMRKISSEELQF